MVAAAMAMAACAHAQTITTAAVPVPGAVAAVPVDGAGMLVLLAGALVAAAAWAFWSGRAGRSARSACMLVVACGVMAAAGYNPSVRAQLAPWMLSFTQAGGETLNIPLRPSPVAGPPVDFQAVQFSNASGRPLRVAGLTGPAGPSSCFPSGVPASLPSTPLPAGTTACAVDLALAPGAACAVDVAAMCAQSVAVAPPVPTLSQVSHPRCDAGGRIFVLLEGSGLTSASAVRFGATAAASVEVLGDTQVRAELPLAWQGGQIDVSVATAYGSAQRTQDFDFAVGRLFCVEGTQPGTYQVFRPVATSQMNSTTAICVLCSVQSAGNAVDGDYDNFSVIQVPLGAGSGSAQQALISPWLLPGSGLAGVIVSFPGQSPEDIAMALGVDMRTQNGTAPSSPQRSVLHRLVGDSDKVLLSVPASQPFDRIEARARAGVMPATLTVQIHAGVVSVSP
jgi:hypothetical protein